MLRKTSVKKFFYSSLILSKHITGFSPIKTSAGYFFANTIQCTANYIYYFYPLSIFVERTIPLIWAKSYENFFSVTFVFISLMVPVWACFYFEDTNNSNSDFVWLISYNTFIFSSRVDTNFDNLHDFKHFFINNLGGTLAIQNFNKNSNKFRDIFLYIFYQQTLLKQTKYKQYQKDIKDLKVQELTRPWIGLLYHAWLVYCLPVSIFILCDITMCGCKLIK